MTAPHTRRSAGLTYVEVLIAVALLAIALVPALTALSGGLRSAGERERLLVAWGRATARAEEVLARPLHELQQEEAASAGAASARYSDPVGTPGRLVVHLALQDGDDADGDGDPTTGVDPDLVHVRVAIEGTHHAVDALATH